MNNYFNKNVSVVEKIWASIFIFSLVFQGVVFPTKARAVDYNWQYIFGDSFEQSNSGLTNKWGDFSGANQPERKITDGTFNVGLSGSKGMLFKSSNSSDPDDGGERNIATKGYSSMKVDFVAAWDQNGSNGAGETFKVDYSLDGGAFQNAQTISISSDSLTHATSSLIIENANRHTKLTLRFYINGDKPNGGTPEDKVGIDNLKVYGSGAPGFYDGFENSNFTSGGWITVSTPSIADQDNNYWTDNNNLITTKGHSAKLNAQDGNITPDDSITKNFSTEGFENIYVRYSRKISNKFDSAEGLRTSYTLNGTDYVDLQAREEDKSYDSVVFGPLPAGANDNPLFGIKFDVAGDKNDKDAYIDDVVIWGTEIPDPTDVVDPVVTITSPSDEDAFTEGAVVDIKGTIVEANPNVYDVTITGPSAYATSTGSLSQGASIDTEATLFSWNTDSVVPGAYVVTLSATDDYGNDSSTSIDLTINAPISYGGIQGMKFQDDNGDGIKNDGEAGLDGWNIYLYDSGWNLEATKVTGDGAEADGVYAFGGLEYGSYHICEEVRSGWSTMGPSGISINTEIDPDGNCVDVTLDSDTETINFGNFQNATVSGIKWNDEDEDGFVGEDEIGILGWEIYLGNGVSTSTVTTNETGHFEFTTVLPGQYKLCEESNGAWAQTYPDTTDGCYDITINQSGQVVSNKGFGNVALPPTSISGYKWNDANENEERDENEGLSGWTITLNWGDEQSVSTTTDSNGYYKFTGLNIDEYSVCEENRAGWMRMNAEDLCQSVNITELGGDYSNINFENSINGEEDILSAPNLVSPANGAYIQSTAVTLLWNDVAGAVNYGFNVFSDENLATLWNSGNGSATTTSFQGVSEGSYWWRVKAYNESSETSAWSNVFKFTVDDTVPTSSFTSPSEGSEWLDFIHIAGQSTDNNNVDYTTLSFATYSGESCGDFTKITDVENGNTTTLPFAWSYDWAPASVGDYCIKASATDLAGNSEHSPIVMNIQYNGVTPTNNNNSGGGGGGGANGPVPGLTFGTNSTGGNTGGGSASNGGSVAFVPPTTGGNTSGGSTGGANTPAVAGASTGPVEVETLSDGEQSTTTLQSEEGTQNNLENENLAAAGSLNFGFLKNVVTSWWFWIILLLILAYIAWYYWKRGSNE